MYNDIYNKRIKAQSSFKIKAPEPYKPSLTDGRAWNFGSYADPKFQGVDYLGGGSSQRGGYSNPSGMFTPGTTHLKANTQGEAGSHNRTGAQYDKSDFTTVDHLAKTQNNSASSTATSGTSGGNNSGGNNPNTTNGKGGGKGGRLGSLGSMHPSTYMQAASNMLPAFYNLGKSMKDAEIATPRFNTEARKSLARAQSRRYDPDYRHINMAQTAFQKAANTGRPGSRAAMLAGRAQLLNKYGDMDRQADQMNQSLADRADQLAMNVGAQEQQARSIADQQTAANEATRQNFESTAVNQFQHGTGAFGRAWTQATTDKMNYNLMGQIHKNYGLAGYNAVINGQASAKDIVKYKSVEAAIAAKQKSDEAAWKERDEKQRQEAVTTKQQAQSEQVDAAVDNATKTNPEN